MNEDILGKIALIEVLVIVCLTYLLINYYVKNCGIYNYFLLLILIIVPINLIISFIKFLLFESEKTLHTFGLINATELAMVVFFVGLTLSINSFILKRKLSKNKIIMPPSVKPPKTIKPGSTNGIWKKRTLIGLGCLVLILIITNPSMQSFKEFLGESSYDGLSRKYNFFLFSIYKDYDGDLYLGFLGNFFFFKS